MGKEVFQSFFLIFFLDPGFGDVMIQQDIVMARELSSWHFAGFEGRAR